MFKKIFSFLFNRETILYVIFGVLTSAVAIGSSYVLFLAFGVDPNATTNSAGETALVTAATVISETLAIAFAFFTNKPFVFESRSWKPKTVVREAVPFVTARALGTVLTILGTGALSIVVTPLMARLILSVVVTIVNYFVSKFIVFKK